MRPPQSARYGVVFVGVLNFLKALAYNEIPFNPFIYIRRQGWRLISYKEHAKKTGKSINDKPPMPGYTLYKNGLYKIYYDETQNDRRLMFTLCHEIGHIQLNHFTDFDKSCFSRGGFTDPEYKALETECDVFAKNILAPLHLVLPLKLDRRGIYTLFNMSWQAAGNRYKTRQADADRLSVQKLQCLQEQHHTFIGRFPSIAKCKKCGYLFLKRGEHCPICGKPAKGIKSVVLVEGLSMFYKEIATNEENQLEECIECENEDILADDKYCKICGNPLVNRCSNYDEQHGDGCGITLLGNARYCTQCGGKSSFLIAGLLPTWQDEKNAETPKKSVKPKGDSELPF